MKIWQKICVFSLILFIITLNFSGIFLIQNFHNSLLKNEIDKCISEEKFLAFELKLNSSPFIDTNNRISSYTDFILSAGKLMAHFSNSLQYNGLFEILDVQNNVIYKDFNFPECNMPPELEGLTPTKTNYLIRNVKGHYYLYICSMIEVGNMPVKVYYANDISSLYIKRNAHYAFFLKLSVFISSILVIFMFLISRLITRPIDVLMNGTQKIASGEYDEKLFFEASDYIYREGKYLEQMAFKMMDLIYAKSQPLTPVDLLSLLSEVKQTLQKKLEEKQILLIIDGPPITVLLDQTLMKILICNVLENAIKASSKSSEIHVNLITSETEVLLSITDTGIGISPEHLDKICDPFYIIDPARTHKNNGSGIGLSVCQKIAEVHHARFTIESQLDLGTTVTFALKKSAPQNI